MNLQCSPTHSGFIWCRSIVNFRPTLGEITLARLGWARTMERFVINLVKRRNSPIIIVPEKENLIKMAIKLQYCAQFTGCDTWTAIGAMRNMKRTSIDCFIAWRGLIDDARSLIWNVEEGGKARAKTKSAHPRTPNSKDDGCERRKLGSENFREVVDSFWTSFHAVESAIESSVNYRGTSLISNRFERPAQVLND